MTFEQIGDDIAAFAEALDLGPVHIAGISDGGIVASTVRFDGPS